MWSLVVVEVYPVTNHAAGMLSAFEAITMHALLLHCPDQPVHHAILLRTVRRDELLVQAIAAKQLRIFPASEDQAVSYRSRNGVGPPKRVKASD